MIFPAGTDATETSSCKPMEKRARPEGGGISKGKTPPKSRPCLASTAAARSSGSQTSQKVYAFRVAQDKVSNNENCELLQPPIETSIFLCQY